MLVLHCLRTVGACRAPAAASLMNMVTGNNNASKRPCGKSSEGLEFNNPRSGSSGVKVYGLPTEEGKGGQKALVVRYREVFEETQNGLV